jgi:CMP-N,N'-diacetyllegionaminic acid synthase
MSKILCTICARGGSKGVPGKNIRQLLGKPLIAHSIAHAKESGLFPAVAVSSDSDEILGIAKAYGADIAIKRPVELATDEAGKVPAIAHALKAVEAMTDTHYDLLVDLDATSPLRLPADINAAVAVQEETGCTSVITGSHAHRSPYFNLVECDARGIARLSKTLPQGVVRRQDSPVCFDMNASIYVWKREALLNNPKVFYDDTRLYIMPRERSHDIDDELDFAIVELILGHRGKK